MYYSFLLCFLFFAFTFVKSDSALPPELLTRYCGELNQCNYVLSFSQDTNRVSYFVNDYVTVMIKLYYDNITLSTNATKVTTSNLSSIYFPRVDNYTLLKIPNSYGYISTLSNIRISFELIHAGKRYELPALKWYSQALQRYIEYRTVVITMNKGYITMIEWEPTKCYFADCDCLDNLCPVQCGSNQTQCNIQIYLGWAGTDAAGTMLQSSSMIFSILPPPL
ncbi:hypothetical protein HMI54_008461 [Coelomomyces lativittatus]|nr:hypothetical protein HMI54_008461 [Coelomomyces lativittatus]